MYLDDFANGRIAMDVHESTEEDVKQLSDLIDEKYPGISIRVSTTYYYPTLISFYEKYKDSEGVCFYNTGVHSWDGYKYLENSGYRVDQLFTAKQILNDETTEITEEDVLELFV